MIWCLIRNAEMLRAQSSYPRFSSALSAPPRFKTSPADDGFPNLSRFSRGKFRFLSDHSYQNSITEK